MSVQQQKQKSRSPISIWGLAEVASALLGVATIAGFLARLWWVFELPSHFRLHWGVGLLVLALLWMLKRRWRMASLCGLGAAVNLFLVLLVCLPVEPAQPLAGTKLRLVVLNVHTENLRCDLVREFLKSADADVVLLMEVDARWMNALQPLRTNYSQVIAQPQDDNFGIALFSRLALTNSEVLELGAAGVPSIATTLSISGRDIFLLGTHPLPPGSAEYARLRNEQLREAAALIRRRGPPAILLGDLNCTPGSPYFADLLRDSGLKRVAQQRGCDGSWPAWLPFARIPLDQGLVSTGLQISNRRTGPNVGSDHLPLILEVAIPPVAQAGKTEAAREP